MQVNPRLLESIEALAVRAAAVVQRIYRSEFTVDTKADATPVTLADQQAEALILEGLAAISPDIPVVAEESVASGRVPAIDPAGRFWLVDPLDGTRDFITRNGEFTVNIALIDAGEPLLGVVHAPALAVMYSGVAGHGAWRTDSAGRHAIHCRSVPAEGLAVVASRSHGDEQALDAFLAGRRVASRVNAGSSLKLCLVAEGRADLYPRLGRTMEWDIAAGHAVLAAAGGGVYGIRDGQPLRYGKAGFENPHFVAQGL